MGRASPSSSQRLQDQQQLGAVECQDHKPPLLPLLQKPATPWPRCSFQNVILFLSPALLHTALSSSHFCISPNPSPRFQPSCYLLQEAFLTWAPAALCASLPKHLFLCVSLLVSPPLSDCVSLWAGPGLFLVGLHVLSRASHKCSGTAAPCETLST